MVDDGYRAYKYASCFSHKKISRCLSVLWMSVLLLPFINTRPSMMTLALILIELISLHTYEVTGKYRYLFIIPILSVIEINLHAALWWMLFIMLLPYMTPGVFGGFRGRAKVCFVHAMKKSIPYWGTGILSFFAGLLNPSGISAVTYLFVSFQNGEIFQYIQELQSPSFKSYIGMVILFAFALLIGYMCTRKGSEYDKTNVYLLMGVLVLSMFYLRNVWTLILGIIPIMCRVLGERNGVIKTKNLTLKEGCLLSGALVLVIVFEAYLMVECVEPKPTQNKIIADYLDNLGEKEDIILYTDFNNGGYMEWRGYKVYIDARPELYQKSINGVENIADEFVEVFKGTINYDAFVSKYHFNYLMVQKASCFQIYLQTSENYKEVMRDGDIILYTVTVHP